MTNKEKKRRQERRGAKNIRKNRIKIKKRKLSNGNEVLFKVPNLKNIPPGCRHLVNQGDIAYVFPGDVACYPNCAAAFFFYDEVFGPNEFVSNNIRRNIKTFAPVLKRPHLSG